MINKYFLPIFISLFTLFFISCGTESTPVYTLSTSVNGEGTISPSSGEFEEGETVTLTGSSTDGWSFVRWEGDWSSTQNPSSISMNSNKNIIGVFERKDFNLTITIGGEGTVQERIVSQPKTTEYPYETVVELTPNPSEGWRFVEWGGDLSGSESPIQITVDREKNVTVTFEKKEYPLNITIEGEGTVEENIVQPKSTEYPFETVVELTPNPSEGWGFVEWKGDISGIENPKQITIDREKNITVKFSPIVFLGENGVTVMCPDGNIGDIGIMDGVEYEVVDNELLRQRFKEGRDSFERKVCVSHVTNMDRIFRETSFNQPIKDWDVSSVTSMAEMFLETPFNQSIGEWDVSNVEYMSDMFVDSQFDQPIGEWDVSNVMTMEWMFRDSQFNQPIENWDVRNVVSMPNMFENSQFNQNISTWCVSHITSEPDNFSTNSPLTSQNKPKWGTCPD